MEKVDLSWHGGGESGYAVFLRGFAVFDVDLSWDGSGKSRYAVKWICSLFESGFVDF